MKRPGSPVTAELPRVAASPGAAGIVHIDDDEWIVTVVANLLGEWRDVRLAGAAPNGAAGFELCRELEPAIALVDLRLPDVDGFSLVARLRALARPPRIIFLSGRNDDAAIFRLQRLPDASFLWKSSTLPQQLRPALEAALAGRAYHPPELRERATRMRRDPLAFFKLLGDSDLALLPLFGRGMSDDEIAASVGRTPLTIKWRRQQIMRKLELHRTVDLMQWAREKGFVEELPVAPPGGKPAEATGA